MLYEVITRYPERLFQFLNGGIGALAAFLAIEGDDEARDFRAGGIDDLVGLANGRAGGDDSYNFV